MTRPASDLWQQALTELELLVDRDSFATWFSPTKFGGLDNQRLVVSVPNSSCRKWLLSNYLDEITGAIRKLTNEDLNIEFRVEPEQEQLELDLYPPESDEPIAGDAEAALNVAVGARAEPSEVEFYETRLNPQYTFANFVVGANNGFAHAAALAVAERGVSSYNPLFIYGGVGLGKTHLTQAIGHRYLDTHDGHRVIYVTSEQFVNSFIDATMKNRHGEFRNHYRGADLLLVDDIHFLIGKERTQVEFFHTFNHLHQYARQIVVSSDRPPKELAALMERLRSRFEWGLTVDIEPPDLEMRMAILKKKAQDFQLETDTDVLVYVAERIQSNIRELEGVLLRLRAYQRLHNRSIDLATAKGILGHLLVGQIGSRVNFDSILEAVCDYFGVKVNDLIGTCRMKKFAYPRHVAQYLCRELAGLSFPEIGARFGGKDHSTVLHACRKIDGLMKSDPNVQNLIAYLTKKIRETAP
jgi:chromosomal replication initiator protein